MKYCVLCKGVTELVNGGGNVSECLLKYEELTRSNNKWELWQPLHSYCMTQQFPSWLYTQEKRKHAPTQSSTQRLIVVLLITAKKWKELKCPSDEEWINKRWYVHSMQCYLAIKYVLHHGWDLMTWGSAKGARCEDHKVYRVCKVDKPMGLGWGGWGKMGDAANRYRFLLGVTKMSSNWWWGSFAQHCKRIKNLWI